MTRPLATVLGLLALSLPGAALAPRAGDEVSPFSVALEGAERAIETKDLDKARALLMRALERDAKSPRAWGVRARLAEAAGDKDELVYSLHVQLRLSVAQKAPRDQVAALRARLAALDPISPELLGMNTKFIGTLEPIADAYEKDGRPHSAIRVHKLILALDPEHARSLEAIDRISSSPDPSLAGDAKPKDLLADVSEEWIRAFDAEHATWETRAKLERENYTTYTNAGYEVLVRAAEAMEQMNRFYREFFQYGTEEDGKTVPRIDLNIFKLRDEYLKLGLGPPVEWSAGHFTGGAVETYVEGQGFEGTTGTLFHEAAHQFVSLATNAAGWLNEGLASFFEGCRILPNGSVIMNMPANHRLFPLAERMEKGWMSGPADGIDPADPAKSDPDEAPTFRIVIENQYAWGPPWYAPTWGVVYFLYNFQDPVDGRFVYRKAFREYVNASGGLQGETAALKFEEVVLAQPAKPIRCAEAKGEPLLELPGTVDELDALWKAWTLELRDEQIGKLERERPFLRWARCAIADKDLAAAQEHFEKGVVADPESPELLLEFAEFLAERKNTDRATKLALEAARVIESREPVDTKALDLADRLLDKWDPKRASIARARKDLLAAATALVGRYRDAKLPMMVMDTSWRLGRDLEAPEMFGAYESALRESGRSLALWELAYNEKNLQGWDTGGNDAFRAAGTFLDAALGTYAADQFDYQMLSLQRVTAGDYSIQADVQAAQGECLFTGLVFGRKDGSNFHAFVYFPGRKRAEGDKAAASGFCDLATFYGGGSTKTWRHSPVAADVVAAGDTSTGRWHQLRIDVAGATVDCWFDGERVATHEFAARDVLRGGFGLLQGRGKARFKDVRFLARDPRDPSGAIERAVRIERLGAGGAAAGGSWLGLKPPFPKVRRWMQAPRAGWDDKGLVPQLLVLWSIDQNELIPIHGWLADVARRHERVGLEILSVASANDDAKIEGYLASHPFPGSVAVDDRAGVGIGTTHELYSTPKFNLPRLLLLDVDGKVAWEGDPGFKIGEKWESAPESFLEAPLKELIEKRKLDQTRAWIDAWNGSGAVALRDGDLAAALPRMNEARQFDGTFVPLAHDVQRNLEALEAAVANLPEVAKGLQGQERGPAVAVLIDWSALLGSTLDKKALATLKPILEGGQSSNWQRALKIAETYGPKLAKSPGALEEAAAKLDGLKGAFPAHLASRLRDCGGDVERAARELAEAPKLPARWLAREHFGW